MLDKHGLNAVLNNDELFSDANNLSHKGMARDKCLCTPFLGIFIRIVLEERFWLVFL